MGRRGVGVVVVLMVWAALGCTRPPQDVCGGGPACAEGQVCVAGQCVEACQRDAECGGARRCNQALGQCEGCLTDEDCGSGLTCTTAGVCGPAAGCTMDAQCPGARCNVDKRACVQCTTNTHCTGGRSCDVERGLCVEPAPECESDPACGARHCLRPPGRCVDCFQDGHCGAGVTCSLTGFVCLVPCADDDSSEPNNTLANAATLPPTGNHSGTLCPADVDVHKVVLPAAGALTITLGVDSMRSAPSLELQDATGTALATGSVSGTSLVLTQPALAAGTYHVRLAMTGSAPTAYTLSSVFTPGGGGGCTQEAGEPNDTPAQAITLTLDGTARGGTLCPADTDHYAVTVTAGDRLRVAAAAQGGVVTVSVLSPGGATLGSGNPYQSDALEAGRHVIVISGGGGAVLAYTLAVSVSAGPPPCRQLDAEPNNTPTQAATVPLNNTPVDGAICPGDTDRFVVVAQAQDRLTGTLSIVAGNGTGPLSLQLLRSDGTEVATVSGALDVPNLTAGRYNVVVLGNNASAQASYRLALNLAQDEPPLDPCLDNGLEPNNTAATATPLTLGANVGARICAMDEDFYALDITTAGVLRVQMAFTHANGDLDLQVRDATGKVVASSTGVTDEEVLEAAVMPGQYVVRVYGFGSATNPYTLTTANASCAGDDELEENDRESRAVTLGPGSYSLVRCPGDDDYWALALLAGDGLNATISGTGLTLELLGPDGALLGSGATVMASGAAAGRYTLRVTGGNSANVTYGLTVNVTAGDGRMCVDDAAEEDDTLLAANRISAVSLANTVAHAVGVACTGDEDWYRVDAVGPTRLTANLRFETGTADLDLSVRERQGYSDQTRSLANSNGTMLEERVEGTIPAAGDVTLQVRRFSGLVGPAYRLEVTAVPLEVPDGGCVDDLVDTLVTRGADGGIPARRDDTFSTALNLSSDGDRAEARAVCAGNSDYYQVYVRTGQKLVVDVRYTYASGKDLDVKVFKPSSQDSAVGFGVSSDDDEHVEYTAIEDGFHRIQVYGFSNASNTYTLSVDVLAN